MNFTPIAPVNIDGNIDQDLLQLAEEVCTKSAMLIGTYNEATINSVKELLRKVNSYYSNMIEAEGTHPVDIDKAMNENYDKDKKKKDLQMLSLVHIDTQKFIENSSDTNKNLFSKDLIKETHKVFYSDKRMKPFLQVSYKNKVYTITAGKIRKMDVAVGNHIAPSFDSLEGLLSSYELLYTSGLHSVPTVAEKLLYALASHHRMVWIHPFLDGNGRTSRLLLDGALMSIGLKGYGLWNISRGLARNADKYKNFLALADLSRNGDYDGRGDLSLKELKGFVKFMLEMALDQVEYMGDCLKLSNLTNRLDAYIIISKNGGYGEPLPKYTDILLKELLVVGELPRGKVKDIIGKKQSTASALIKELLDRNFIQSQSQRGNIRISFNAKFATFLFPDLIPPYN